MLVFEKNALTLYIDDNKALFKLVNEKLRHLVAVIFCHTNTDFVDLGLELDESVNNVLVD